MRRAKVVEEEDEERPRKNIGHQHVMEHSLPEQHTAREVRVWPVDVAEPIRPARRGASRGAPEEGRQERSERHLEEFPAYAGSLATLPLEDDLQRPPHLSVVARSGSGAAEESVGGFLWQQRCTAPRRHRFRGLSSSDSRAATVAV